MVRRRELIIEVEEEISLLLLVLVKSCRPVV